MELLTIATTKRGWEMGTFQIIRCAFIDPVLEVLLIVLQITVLTPVGKQSSGESDWEQNTKSFNIGGESLRIWDPL